MTVYGGDIDTPELSSSSMRTARTTHKCCECKRDIVRGQRYEHASGRWERRFQTFRTCEACLILREHVIAETEGDGWSFGELLSDAQDSADEARLSGAGSRVDEDLL